MDLLDLPPEIFQNIMYHYIKMHKVESIPEILFAHNNLMLYMPRGMYSFKLGYKFYKAQISLILQARVKQARRNEELNGVYPFLPKYVNEVVNRVYKTAGLQDVSDNNRDRDEANLCDGKYLSNHAFRRRPENFWVPRGGQRSTAF
ncbi:hypothetical protein SLS60_006868 [Paraconiothyrium brasiliense]|uniref:F-box domain-containing protein n=1 Tax=Paraconiothyrium brasiliense TaxID=300254 RepID=A0ABR3R7Z2_9PLEO